MWGDVGYFSPKTTLTKTKRPIVQLSDRARWSDTMRGKTVHLSVSDEIDNVIAYVIIEEEYNV
jgi:phosphopantetheinyl transferase (holo-ACP synthase)